MSRQVSVWRKKKIIKDRAIELYNNSSDLVLIHTKRNELDIFHENFYCLNFFESFNLSLQSFNAIADTESFF